MSRSVGLAREHRSVCDPSTPTEFRAAHGAPPPDPRGSGAGAPPRRDGTPRTDAPSKRISALGILNGAVGDHLHATNNALAIEMSVVRGTPGQRVAIFLHGLMCTEEVWTFPDGSDYGSLLAKDLGYSPLFVRFNTGRSIASSSADFARLLDVLTTSHPEIEEILLVGYSMGGLVIRSACHLASALGNRWLSLVRRAIYLGTPHLGSPWERAGRWLVQLLRGIDDPFTQLVGTLGDLRSTGIKNLGDADDAPLLARIEHHFIAGSLDSWIRAHLGDSVVPLASATNGICAEVRADAPRHVKIIPGLTHLALPRHPAVYAQIRAWCEGAST